MAIDAKRNISSLFGKNIKFHVEKAVVYFVWLVLDQNNLPYKVAVCEENCWFQKKYKICRLRILQ
jgi:hypothetical protein